MYETHGRSSAQSGGTSRTVRRWQVAGTVAVATAMVGVGLGVAAADENGAAASREGSIVCPGVAGELPAVPAQAADEIRRNLALLNTQVAEAQRRFETSAGQGGANFVQNAILGPLKGKRESTINRMATAIGRNAEKPVLDVQTLSTCVVDTAGGVAVAEPAEPPAGVDNGTAAGDGAAGDAAGEEAAGGAAAVGTISCPGVAGELPAIPAQAAAEIERNLALLNTQVAEAQRRLETSVGQGGANFVQNAILGPLKSKRTAVINRMATAIGRNADKPVLDVQTLSTCTVEGAGAAVEQEPAAPPAGVDNGEQAAGEEAAGEDAAAGGAAGGSIACPDVAGELPAIPAQAQAEVTRNLELLQTQINEAENRLETSKGQGGPNFVQNAILGPLEDKRIAVINRIATAIGRNADKPVLDVANLAPCALQ